nr:ubiquitin hydrolase [Tanacetum cinerariifolium]
DKAAERSTTNKVETVKKPSIRYVKLYRKPSKKPTVRGNQRNWNNLKSHQLGANFVMKKKACYRCGGIDHLSYDCGLGVKKGRTCPKNNYTHRSMPPRPATHRPYRPHMRPNMNSAWPNKPTHSYGRRPFQETTQDLVVILIQRVQRLKRELKVRNPIHKVDRGRSRPVMACVPKKKLDCRCSIKFKGGLLGIKCSKIFPLSVMNSYYKKKFPLLEEVPTSRIILPLMHSCSDKRSAGRESSTIGALPLSVARMVDEGAATAA